MSKQTLTIDQAFELFTATHTPFEVVEMSVEDLKKEISEINVTEDVADTLLLRIRNQIAIMFI